MYHAVKAVNIVCSSIIAGNFVPKHKLSKNDKINCKVDKIYCQNQEITLYFIRTWL